MNKNSTQCLKVLAGLLLFYVMLSMLFPGREKYTKGDMVTVYGTMSCPWTKKQIDYFKEKDIKYEFKDCKNGDCPSSIKAHPTLEIHGEMMEGFKEL